MQTIVVNSQKGGSGKTTLTAALAVEAERVNDGPAWLIDTDKQGTLSLWHERREAETPQRADVEFSELGRGLELMEKKGAAYCFIDTAPTRTDENRVVLALADLVIIPVRPSPSDLWSVAETVKVVQELGKPFVFVLTQAKANASLTAQAAAALSRHGRVAEAFIQDRVPYAAAMTDGRTAPELATKSAPAVEIAALWKDIKACLHASMPTTKEANHA